MMSVDCVSLPWFLGGRGGVIASELSVFGSSRESSRNNGVGNGGACIF